MSPSPVLAPSFSVDPKRSALLLIDLQRMFLDTSCSLPEQFATNHPEEARYFFERIQQCVIPRVVKVLGIARTNDVPVFFTTIGSSRSDEVDLAPWKQLRNDRMKKASGGRQLYYPVGTPEHGIVNELKPMPGDFVMNKTTFSAFLTTALDLTLRALGKDTLFICGLATNGCVQATGIDAADRGYMCVLIEDCCAAWEPRLHDSTIENFGRSFGAVVLADQASDLLIKGGSVP